MTCSRTAPMPSTASANLMCSHTGVDGKADLYSAGVFKRYSEDCCTRASA